MLAFKRAVRWVEFPIKEDMKVDSPVLGGGGLGGSMADSFFSEDDSSIVTSSCHFSLCDAQENNLSLFGGDSVDDKADYSWDSCFGNLEDVDNLLSSDPESTFGRVSCSPATLQWADSASPLDLQSESELSGTKSSSVIDAGPGVNEKVDVFDLEMEFVPINAPLSIPCGGIGQNTTFIEAEFQPATSFESRLPNNHVQAELQSDPHSGAQANSSDCLDDAKMMEVLTGSMATSESTENVSMGMDAPEDESGPSSVSVSDSEKVKVAQAQRARRHAVTRKRLEERSKRQLNHRKGFHGAGYGGPRTLHPMPMHMPAQVAHLNQPSTPNMHSYPVNPSNLSPAMQPMFRPGAPYMHGGYSPMHVMPQVAPPTGPAQLQGQGLYVGYPQPCAFPQPLPPYQHQLRPPGKVSVRPPPSTSTMTPQEKIEKLKLIQQMHARLAVEQQGQQFAAQGVAPLDTSGPRKGVTPMLPCVASKEVDVGVKLSETKMPVTESDTEPSLSVGQTVVDGVSDDEGGSLESAVLDQLQNTIKTHLELGTRICIRDALYRLARSAMRRQASGGRATADDTAKCSQASQDADATSTGLEASTNSDPSSLSRVSRMDMTMVETQTNPIDRSIAHLLFHKMQPQPNSAQVSPSDDGNRAGFQQTNTAGQVNGHAAWNQGTVAQGNWAGQKSQLNQTGDICPGIASSVDMVSAPSLPPPKVLMIPKSISRSQDDSVLRTVGSSEHQSGISSAVMKKSTSSGHLQGNVTGVVGMSVELPSSMGSQLQSRSDGEQLVRPTQNLTSSLRKESSKLKNGFQWKRLQHAVALKELSQVLAEDPDVASGPLCKEESGLAQSAPPVSPSSGSDECQAGGLSNLSKNLGDKDTSMDETV
ncbi:uncharacterized protein [Physcomitrium patens]|uniref:Uncharacterized protein n=4 Tax=Physcomitrium patens TaxID=3218 RepID=A0A7I4DDE4_PHYPA|nr:uncharacterized protein LOC112280178 isoform X1 [Physcomitrium patens]|eukprot:XP_024371112.1 uncharacterized protein LOC112280178 isoform X1 [Physcomitrella patens]